MITLRVDIAVVGGGVVGAALALALGRAGFEVALIDARGAPEAPMTPDPRVYALSPSSLALLTRLGIEPARDLMRASPYRTMRVWRDDPARELSFDAALIGATTLGVIVEDAAIRHALWQRLAGASVEVMAPRAIAGFTVDGRDARLALDDRSHVRAALVVAADGAGSPLRALADLETHRVDVGQRAVIATFATTARHQATAWQRFTADGPLAFLPLADGTSSIVWSRDTAAAEALVALDRAAFEAAVADGFGHRLGALKLLRAPLALPLATHLAMRYAAPRLALAGDAAHAVHPLAGQGLNLGLADVGALVDTVIAARDAKADLGDSARLRAYERWRQGEVALIARSFDWIDGAFRGPRGFVGAIADLGLDLVARASPLKREFAWTAAGFGGRVARLNRRLSIGESAA